MGPLKSKPVYEFARQQVVDYLRAMTLEEIKASIAHLTLEERAEVARCLHEWSDDDWDRQMKNDLASGKLDALLGKVDADIEHGKLLDLP